jgi:hypothetical protein
MHWTDSRNLQTELMHPEYDPDFFLDTIMQKAGVSSDRALARELDVAPPVISKIRSRALGIGPTFLVRIHELTNLKIKELRELMFGRDIQGQSLDKYSVRRRLTRTFMPLVQARLKLHAGDSEVHIWTVDRRIAINIQARCGASRLTVGIANVGDKSVLSLPTKREISACSPLMGRKLLGLAQTGLALFDDLSDTDGGPLRQDKVRDRFELIKDITELRTALNQVSRKLKRSAELTNCYI